MSGVWVNMGVFKWFSRAGVTASFSLVVSPVLCYNVSGVALCLFIFVAFVLGCVFIRGSLLLLMCVFCGGISCLCEGLLARLLFL